MDAKLFMAAIMLLTLKVDILYGMEVGFTWTPNPGDASGYEICGKPRGTADWTICELIPGVESNTHYMELKWGTEWEMAIRATIMEHAPPLYSSFSEHIFVPPDFKPPILEPPGGFTYGP